MFENLVFATIGLLFNGCVGMPAADEPESIWLEAEHLEGIEGHCWPLGDETRQMTNTHGHWGLSGPGWAAEWNQGGESGFLSIAAGPDETAAVATHEFRVPRSAQYQVWVRYADWREQTEKFEIALSQSGSLPQRLQFGAILAWKKTTK